MIASGTPEEGQRDACPHRLRLTEAPRSWSRMALMAALLLVVAPPVPLRRLAALPFGWGRPL